MRALAGAADVAASLRYKKKMMMWSLPAPAPSRAAQAPPAAGADADMGVAGGAGGAAARGVMGYCMMTFVIRNGLKALSLGEGTYLGYVENLARR